MAISMRINIMILINIVVNAEFVLLILLSIHLMF